MKINKEKKPKLWGQVLFFAFSMSLQATSFDTLLFWPERINEQEKMAVRLLKKKQKTRPDPISCYFFMMVMLEMQGYVLIFSILLHRVLLMRRIPNG